MRSTLPATTVRRAAIAALAACLVPALAHAQAYQRVAPKEPPAAPPPVVTPPAEPAVSPAPNTVVLPALRGLVFLPAMTSLHPDGAPAGTTGIDVAALPLLADPEFSGQLAPFIGQPLTFAALQDITNRTTAWYRAHGRPFVAVTVPPQNISTGVVQVVVTEYRVGAVNITGNQWFSSDLLRQESGLSPGQTLTLPGVQDDLDWLNSNPFRTVNTLFQPGADPGTTDVVLQTQDRLPVRLYAGYDNAGVSSLGRGEWSVGGVWGNAFGLDQILSYQYTRGVSGRYDAHAISWSAPLPWRDKLLVFGSYEQETPNIGSTFSENGNNGQASIRYVHTLPRMIFSATVALTHVLQIGYDFKTTNNNLEFGGTQVFNSQAEIDQFPVIYDATLADPFGQTAFENQLVLSPGGMTGANNSAAFQAVVPGSAADYVYDRVGLTRTTILPAGFSWSSRVIGQVSNRNLLYSEQLGAGGADSVRGYFTDTALGSQGVLVSQELRTPPVSLAHVLHLGTPVSDQQQFGVFWDYGHVSQVQSIPNAINTADLSSVGIDLHATVDRYIDIKFDLGWELRNVPGTDKRGAFGDIAVVVGF
jgi:hemolysin activation/secretion protein